MMNLGTLLRNVFRKQHVEQELDEEIRFYEDSLTQEGVEAGASEEQARRAARLTVGSVTSLKDSVRDVRTGAMLERVWRDFRYAIRSLRNKPGFAAAAVLVLALGIGANSAVFSLVDAFLLKPLAIAHPEQLTGLYSRDTKHPDAYRGFSYPNYVDIRDDNPVFSRLMAHDLIMVGIKDGDNTRRTFADIVSANYFSTLGVSLLKGRAFSPEEEKPGADLTVIVSYPFWKKAGEDPRLLGKQVRINGHLFTVIAITRQGFTGMTALVSPELFVPLGTYNLVMNDFESHGKPLNARDNNALILVGRLREGVTPSAADRMLPVVGSRLEKAFPAENKNQTLFVHSLSRMNVSTGPTDDTGMRIPAILLMSLAAVVLLIACLNLANMMMAKGAARRKEIAIRLAIGGGRRRIVQQLVTESLVVAILGGAAGLFVESWSTTLLFKSLAGVAPLELVYDPSPDARVLAATLTFCALSAIVFGLFPAWKLSKPDTWLDLKENSGEDSAGRVRGLFSRGNVLVMAQLSLSLMMLTAAGLFIFSARRAANIDPGFSLDHQLLAEMDASLNNYGEMRGRQIYNDILERLARIPGVQSVAMAAAVPFGNLSLGTDVQSAHAGTGHPVFARFNIVTNDYFHTLGIPLLRGRSFTRPENSPTTKSHVVVIDATAAAKLFPGGNPLGKQIRLDDAGDGKPGICEVVGVVGKTRDHLFGDTAELHVYVPFGQQYQGDMQIHLKVAGGPEAEARLLKRIRREIRNADERLPLLSLTSMREHLESGIEIWVVRTGARVLEIFGAVALLLAVIGLYAVNAYTVARRTREIGIRMAIGADASSTRRMILGQGLRVTAVGVGVGLLLAIGLSRLLAGFLYGVGGFDPIVLLSAPVILTVVALAACYLPARRASRIDPMIALRYE